MNWTMMAAGALALLLLAGCAKNPDAIAPMSMPINAYSGLDCTQLASEFDKSAAGLYAVSQEQRNAVAGDAVGVFLIGVPVSSLTGANKEGLVSQRKGEIVAIQGAQRQQGCSVSQMPEPPKVKPVASAATR